MQPIDFHSPDTVEAACELLDRLGDDAEILAGGQSLNQLLKQRLVDATDVIHIGDIDELEYVRSGDGEVSIGAAVTYESVRQDPTVEEYVPILPEGISTIGDTQIRSQGTLVGGIAHADPQGDPPVLAVATDADIVLRSVDGVREVSASEFYTGLFETARRESEILTEVVVPAFGGGVHGSYRSFTRRQGDYAIASIAAVIEYDGQTVRDASVVAGCVADTPATLDAVESCLEGTNLDEDAIREATERAREVVPAYGDTKGSESYKRELVGTLLEDALKSLPPE